MGFPATLGGLGDAVIGEWAVGAAHAEFTRPRTVPIPPELVVILRTHIENFGVARTAGSSVANAATPSASPAISDVWADVRTLTPTSAQVATPLAGRPYDQRHAGVSLWPAAGIPAPRVAERAGHSVEVLLRLYAKCLGAGETIADTQIDLTLINLVRTYPAI